MHAPRDLPEKTDFPPITRNTLETLQVNLGYRCNLSCVHCHVGAGPRRAEIMDRGTIDQVLDFIAANDVKTLDLTGGAPEMSPCFHYLVDRAAAAGIRIIDRCNLTILEEPGYEGLADYLAERQVEITASLPCYLEENVDKQRGRGVFDKSIRALKRLNRLGYGDPGSALVLNLVFNPQGAVLPPPQETLERAYKTHLGHSFGIRFNRLYTLTNMPIERFGSMLVSKGLFEDYMRLLRESFQAANLDSVMCRTTLSVDWRGYVYDCDFNQMLKLPPGATGRETHLSALTAAALSEKPVTVRRHCYGCAAGQGSSCGGALK